jgi:DNA polymerase delta subunit 1
MDTILAKILWDKDENGAAEFVKHIVASLLQNKLDLSLLVISKALSKEGKEYAGKQAHVELAKKLHKRDVANAPGIGDRVPYVIVQARKGARAYEKAEDPLFVLEKNIPLDYEYYIENQLRQPVTRIFRPIMKDPGQLFAGKHMRMLTRTTPTCDAGGIASFVTRTLRCLGCRGPLPPGLTTVCEACKAADKEADIYMRQLTLVGDLEQKYGRAWVQCLRCMGSYHQPVLCFNRDCPIFYMRTKVRKDLQEAQRDLDRFSDEYDW